jgi:sulfite reductase subunit B
MKIQTMTTTLSQTKPPLYLPFRCKIEHIEPLTQAEKLFRFVRLDQKPFGHKPGQFFQVSIEGIGEAPISVSSSPTRGNYLEMGIRQIGKLTQALHQLKIGDEIGLRGPFGTFFPIEKMIHHDIVLVAGGCGLAPLRSLIQYIEDKRNQFGKVVTLYGTKSPQDIMYASELAKWKNSDLNCQMTVDNVTEGSCWDGSVGLITKLIPPLDLNPSKTIAVICGPPIMYKFVIQELRKKNIADNHIIVSLERYMKCGVGKCGHCNIEHLYCCIDGPVFRLSEIVNVRKAL